MVIFLNLALVLGQGLRKSPSEQKLNFTNSSIFMQRSLLIWQLNTKPILSD
ncbi:hypothetical protein THERMOS_1145 [Bathymodiolus thermophilus thioautotrophic gill symbiont]|uniref:Uncharacterized protein n=1 Tax=Bathymodiolus thermophilus thioautotrophic gill symbiont TaxID=2360 RepID=A0A8H8XBW0_9GAMM|nr:hypothetical protein THERMOS_1145 [Bathymodiolus thermophilus thioautotrophic gill symbiont]